MGKRITSIGSQHFLRTLTGTVDVPLFCTHFSVYKFMPLCMLCLTTLLSVLCISISFLNLPILLCHIFLASVRFFFSLNINCLLHCMLEGENLNYYQQRKNNGESKLCTGPFRPVAAFTWVPSGNCASIANNIQLEWYLLLLLPLGQASISPSILRQQHRSRSRRRPFIFEI